MVSVSRLPFCLSPSFGTAGGRAGDDDNDDVDDDNGLSSHVWSDAHGLFLFSLPAFRSSHARGASL